VSTAQHTTDRQQLSVHRRSGESRGNPLIRLARTPSLTIAEVTLPPNFRVPKHDHEQPHIVVVLEGAIRDHTRQGSTDLTEGWIRYSPGAQTHLVASLERGARVVILEAAGFPPLELASSVYVNRELAAPIVDHLQEQLFCSPFASPADVEESAIALFTMIRTQSRRSAARRHAWLSEIRERLASPSHANESLGDLAAIAGCHPTFLSRTFRSTYGVSIGEYRRRKQVQIVWRLLADSSVPLSVVAARGGYTDQSHMTRTFRRSLGDTPGAIRSRLATREFNSWFAAHELSVLS
jgi:AraC family transcriptional regulator